MINKEYGVYQCICDVCGHGGEEYDTLDMCVEMKHNNDFVSKKVNGEWLDLCFECEESEEYK